MATTFTTPRDRQARDFTNLGLWTFQGWLAMFFIAAGYAKITQPLDTLTTLMTCPGMVADSFVRGLGIAEIALALGLLVPLISWKVGRPVMMTAAIGLAILETIMLGVHVLDLDIGLAVTNAVLLALTVSVLLGRRALR